LKYIEAILPGGIAFNLKNNEYTRFKLTQFMKRLLAFVLCYFFISGVFSQTILGTTYIDDNGAMVDEKIATGVVIVKKINESKFEKHTYLMDGPLETMDTYSDQHLSVLEGIHTYYYDNGRLAVFGWYHDNKKDKSWLYYDDTMKLIKEEIYEQGVMVKVIDPDTVKKVKAVIYGDEREAEFQGGATAWRRYIGTNINSDIANIIGKGGTVVVSFIIEPNGATGDIYLSRSVAYLLDAEVLRMIYKMPPWQPAFQNGKNVRAYRHQPCTILPENFQK
jgi:hypothetical protein